MSQGSDGIPKSIRGNVNQVCIWRTGNKKELDLLMTELSGQIPKEKLIRAYNAVMDRDPDDKHACLVVDLNPNLLQSTGGQLLFWAPQPLRESSLNSEWFSQIRLFRSEKRSTLLTPEVCQ